MIRSLCLALLLAAPTVRADVPTRLGAAFETWAAEAGAGKAVLTIWHEGKHHSDVALGMDADTPVELASLGKAVTALCAVSLMEAGVWTAETKARDVLGIGPEDLSVAHFMTHSGGLGPDQTQGLMPLWLDTSADRSTQAARRALMREEQTGNLGEYAYNNENYAVLGAMIAAETGHPYADYCADAVLKGAGVTTAQLSARTGGMASWGGWQMSVQDYARLMHWAYGPEGIVGRVPEAWPHAAMGGGAYYGVGMTQRAFRGSMNYWHFGLLCFPGRMNAGSYAVRWMDEWSVVAAFDACPDWDRLIQLDGVLSRAVFQ